MCITHKNDKIRTNACASAEQRFFISSLALTKSLKQFGKEVGLTALICSVSDL
jgi:hypothetical protein